MENSDKKEINRYGEHIAISVTNSCPLQCKHCISGSTPDTARADAGLVDGFIDFLDKWPRISRVTFTGGEPFHHPKELARFADACKSRNIRYAVITSAFWAKSSKNCDTYLQAVPNLAAMTVSTDLYHQQFVTDKHVMNAVYAARERGIPISVRFTHADPMSEAEQELHARLKKYVSVQEIEYAPLQKYGRAETEGIGREYDHWKGKGQTHFGLCPSTGPHIFENGRVTPCCNTIVSLRNDNHPLVFGNLLHDGAKAVHKSQAENTLWMAIKVLGFDWLHEQLVELKPSYIDYGPIDACDFCYDVCREGNIHKDVMTLMTDPNIALYVHSIMAFVHGGKESAALLPGLARSVKAGRKNSPVDIEIDNRIKLTSLS